MSLTSSGITSNPLYFVQDFMKMKGKEWSQVHPFLPSFVDPWVQLAEIFPVTEWCLVWFFCLFLMSLSPSLALAVFLSTWASCIDIPGPKIITRHWVHTNLFIGIMLWHDASDSLHLCQGQVWTLENVEWISTSVLWRMAVIPTCQSNRHLLTSQMFP